MCSQSTDQLHVLNNYHHRLVLKCYEDLQMKLKIFAHSQLISKWTRMVNQIQLKIEENITKTVRL